jgi:putative hydrolase of the HAD superfamily
MPYDAISFDAAGTLIKVDWQPERIALQAAQIAEIQIPDPQVAAETYLRLLHSRWKHFQQLNLHRSEQICSDFWRELGHDWLTKLQIETTKLEDLYQAADNLLFGPESTVFTLYPDSLPTLQAIAERKLHLLMLSNWDVSLHRVCRILDLTPFFDHIIASLEEGVEKPDPGLFQIAQSKLPGPNVLHIGDSRDADYNGALAFGWHALLLDRDHPAQGRQIQTLSQVLDHL